jgi:hypothetical protein
LFDCSVGRGGVLSDERARWLAESGISEAPVAKWSEVLRLAGHGTTKPPGYWHRNVGDAVGIEPGGWARFPKLARVCLSLVLEHKTHVEIRGAACRWLTDFATVDVAEALGARLLDPAEAPRVRSEAAATLGAHQLRDRDERPARPRVPLGDARSHRRG